MNIARVSKVHDQIVKDILWAHEQEIRSLREDIELLKRPVSAIGFHQNPNAAALEMAFPKSKFRGGD